MHPNFLLDYPNLKWKLLFLIDKRAGRFVYLPHFDELVLFSFVTASISKVYDLLRLFLSFPLAFSPSCVSSSVLFQRKPGQGHQHLLTLGNLGPS